MSLECSNEGCFRSAVIAWLLATIGYTKPRNHGYRPQLTNRNNFFSAPLIPNHANRSTFSSLFEGCLTPLQYRTCQLPCSRRTRRLELWFLRRGKDYTYLMEHHSVCVKCLPQTWFLSRLHVTILPSWVIDFCLFLHLTRPIGSISFEQ